MMVYFHLNIFLHRELVAEVLHKPLCLNPDMEVTLPAPVAFSLIPSPDVRHHQHCKFLSGNIDSRVKPAVITLRINILGKAVCIVEYLDYMNLKRQCCLVSKEKSFCLRGLCYGNIRGTSQYMFA